MFEFEKEKLETISGTKGSKYDSLYEEFQEVKDTIYFDPDKVSAATASNIAKRLNILLENEGRTDVTFISGLHALKKKRFVSLRSKKEEEENEEESNEE